MTRRPALLAALAIVAACQTGPTATPLAPSPSAIATGAATPAAPVALEWAVLDLPDTVGFWSASGVIADADGFVVFGNVGDRSAVWTSDDGVEWASSALPGDDGRPARAAANATATVLLGFGSTERCAHPFGEFLWRRAARDPAWTAAPFNDLFCAGGGADIVANAEGFVVAGTGSGEQPFAWASDDGLGWHDASAGLSQLAPPWVVASAEAGFLELGRGTVADARESDDGRSWSPVPAPLVAPAFNGDGPGMTPSVLFETKLGMFAMYQSDDGLRFASLRGADGEWTDLPLDGVGETGWVSSGVSLADGKAPAAAAQPMLFVVRDGKAIVLTSSDLQRWVPVEIPELSGVVGLARFGDRAVLVGSTVDANGDDHASVWSTTWPE